VTNASLRDLGGRPSIYTVPGDDLVKEILIPAMSSCDTLRCMAGYFHSSALRHLAPGLAAFVNGTRGTFRLLISPVLDDADRETLRSARTDPERILREAYERVFTAAQLDPSAIEQHTLDCLGYLLASNRLAVRFVLMPDGGMFHPKVWIFKRDTDLVVVHGSSNVTTAGLLFNFEAVSVERSWASDEAHERSVRLAEVFERLWVGEEERTLTLDLSDGIALASRLPASDRAPTIDDYWQAWHEDAANGLAPPLPKGHHVPAPNPLYLDDLSLTIPSGLAWEHGPFAHQACAVAAWEAAEGRGLLSMATGSGKTITSLVCASRLQQAHSPLLVVIAAPYKPLVEQWATEVEAFGVRPLDLARMSGADRLTAILDAVRRLERDLSGVEVVVVTHDFLVSDALYSILDELPSKVTSLLIADEVHNLGRPRFLARPPEQFDYRLGLSATPVLQYNEAGTEAIALFFGPTVFEFSLADAIGVCLVPYNYHLHPVQLERDEEEVWEELTAKLRRAGFRGVDDGSNGSLSPKVLALLVKRRAVLEAAVAKVTSLVSLLTGQGIDAVKHTLVYCSDKRPEQLLTVNRMLMDEGFFVRQITADETSNRARTQQILDDFAIGNYQILTCKRVLDEGVDLPQVRTAFLLASSTVRRQWVQRRGRILRRCDAIDKRLAYLHDFLVVPTDPTSATGRAILQQELERGRAFAELAANAGDLEGPFAVMSDFTPTGDW